MLKKDIISLYNGLNSVGSLVGVIFGYAVNKNISIIKPEIEALQKVATPAKEFLEFDQKRIDIVKKYAKKDDKGDFIVKDNQYDVGENRELVEQEVEALKEENRVVIDARDKQINEYNTLLEEEVKVDLYKVKLESVPKDITAAQMASIFLIVDGE